MLRGPAWSAFVAVVVVVSPTLFASSLPSPQTELAANATTTPSSSRGPDGYERGGVARISGQQQQDSADGEVAVLQDSSLAEADKGQSGHAGHSGHSGHNKPVKMKKKKPAGKHKKKKQSFKDKLLPLLLIPFVIQTMLIPMFIMNLKMLAMKAMTVGKFAVLLIAFNMFRSWQQNAQSTKIRGTMDSLIAQNYGYNGGPEYGALWNGR